MKNQLMAMFLMGAVLLTATMPASAQRGGSKGNGIHNGHGEWCVLDAFFVSS